MTARPAGHVVALAGLLVALLLAPLRLPAHLREATGPVPATPVFTG